MMKVLQIKIKEKTQDEGILKFQCWKLHKKKQTLKITLSPTKLKGIAYKLKCQKNAAPTFSHGERIGAKVGFIKKK